jgi:hypothetical protein
MPLLAPLSDLWVLLESVSPACRAIESGAAVHSAQGRLLRTSSSLVADDEVVPLALTGIPADMPGIVGIDAPRAVPDVFPRLAIVSQIINVPMTRAMRGGSGAS